MSSTYEIEPKNRDSGDYSDTEGILRFGRIRVERQEILLGDSDPMICLCGQDIIVAGKGGGLVKSHDGGISWGTTRTIPGMLPDDKLCALGVDANDRLMVATWSEEALSIQFSDDGAVTFGSPVTVHAPAGPGAAPGRFMTCERQLLLFLNTAVFASEDHEANWSKLTDLPAGWSHLRPTVLSDGTMVGTAAA